MSIIEVHPSSDFSLEEEGGVVFPVVTDHSHQVKLCLSSLFFCHSVKQLQRNDHHKHWWHRGLSVRSGSALRSYITKAQAGTQSVDDVLSQIRMIRVPNQADGDDLRTVEEDTSHAELLPTLTLRKKEQMVNLRLRRTKACFCLLKPYRTAAQVSHAGIS